MNRAVAVFTAVAAVAAVAWCEAAGPARRRPRGRPSGGLVTKAYTGRKILVAAGAAAVPAGLVEEALEGVRRTSRLPVFAAEAGGTPLGWDGAVAAAKGLVRGGAAAVVVADGGCPAALVAAPDEGWAVVDASALLAGADVAHARGRMSKGLWRAVAYALGTGGASSCVTGAAWASGGVDALPAAPAPDTLNRMVDAAAARGAGLLSFASYRTACEEGWAPAPTNDVQRAIWEKVHAIPDKPITIEFAPKRDR